MGLYNYNQYLRSVSVTIYYCFVGLDARGCNFPVCAGAFYVATTECIGSIEDPPVFLACMAADAAFSGSCCGCMVTQDITPTTTPFQDDCNAVACAGAMGTSYLACAGIEDPLDWVPCIVGFAGVKGFCGPCCCEGKPTTTKKP